MTLFSCTFDIQLDAVKIFSLLFSFFKVSAEMHHDALVHLLENEPELLDFILRRRLLRTHGVR